MTEDVNLRQKMLEADEMEPRLEKQELPVCGLNRSGGRDAVAGVCVGAGVGNETFDDAHGEKFGDRFFNGPLCRFICAENKRAPSPGP